ncbi:MAG TPA: dihydroorotate dehydrogenase-like protein [Phycisphaerae bacterium]|nr:dihydroorotate dehydrogenase-like protein [Phycisphaerae bacterium]
MDLKTTYMGLELGCPLVPSASPLSREIDNIRRMEDAGAGAVVLWSLFEEQIEHEAAELEHYLRYGADRFAESLTYFPEPGEFPLGPNEYLDHIAKAKRAAGIPVIGSLNGISTRGWISYARQIEQAGADGLELNVYFIPTDPAVTADQVEDVYISVLQAVKASVSIPVAMKLSPFFSATAAMARKLDEAGADALVLFNRFYQPDIDIAALEVVPTLELSTPFEQRLPLRWIAILRGAIKASLAATTGVRTGQDAAKMILAGADAVMMCSALLERGIEHLAAVRKELVETMEEKNYDSVEQMKGVMSQQKCAEPAAFERANYIKALNRYGLTATRE